VFKKRPSLLEKGNAPLLQSKANPAYWQNRLFRNTFTHRGKRFQVNHWSVKIQHQGTRKTFSLRQSDPSKAATEACRLYRTIRTQGWESANAQDNNLRLSAANPDRTAEKLSSVQYWSERLIYRKYTEKLHPDLERELSVRIHHAGASYYFPLRTDNREVAAKRAARVYEAVTHQGWDKANKRFPRELSIAFHWVENPVAWTYSTIQTQTNGFQLPSENAARPPLGMLNVAIAESDAGIRRALAWCVDKQEGYCALANFASAAQALSRIPHLPIHLVLVSQNLADQAGASFLKSLTRLAPKVTGLVFSVYEDCDLLFGCAPGGAASYLFRRTPPTRMLEPIAEAWSQGNLTRDYIASKVRQYFETAVTSLPVGGSSSHALSNLTQRELEILGSLSKGQSDKEIADLLRISTWTVHGHLKKIFEKLGAHNRTEAVLKYLHK